MLQSVNGPAATILDGVHANGKRGVDLSASVYFQAQTVAGFTFRNFTVTNGYGAALHCSSDRTTSFTLSDCIFENNRHVFASGTSGTGWGGAAWITLSRSVAPLPHLLVSNCVFRGNTCRNGGSGMYLHGIYGGATVTDSLFDRNTNTIYGGAIYCNAGSSAREQSVFRRCEFRGNISGQQGGAVFGAAAFTDLRIEDCLVEDNEARSGATWAAACKGGGLYLAGTDECSQSGFSTLHRQRRRRSLRTHVTLYISMIADNESPTRR